MIKQNHGFNMRKLSPWMLLLPAFVLMIGVFFMSLFQFFSYSLYSYTAGKIEYTHTFYNYIKFVTDGYYANVLLTTITLAAKSTALALLIGYPLAYACVRLKSPAAKMAVIVIVFLPLVISVVVRLYGWFILLSTKGFINWLLQAVGITSKPIQLLYKQSAIVVGNVHVLLAYMVFPIFSSLSSMSPSVKEAAYDLGANKLRRFMTVTFPLSISGVLSGVQVVFTLALSAYVTPVMLGGGRIMVLARVIYEDTLGMNWPMAAASGAIMLALSFVILTLFNRIEYFVRTE